MHFIAFPATGENKLFAIKTSDSNKLYKSLYGLLLGEGQRLEYKKLGAFLKDRAMSNRRGNFFLVPHFGLRNNFKINQPR